MRLTLRTMLAYLDDILEPGDARELGEKIEESEFASGLVHRIRGSMRRLRLGTPKLEGKGMGLDPNTVAEYLDNTLPADRVPDFEKVCLESDVHLAEVASCHQILTLVLGEPAEVSSSARQRAYGIAATTAAEPAAAETAPTPATDPAAEAPVAAAATVAAATATASVAEPPTTEPDQPDAAAEPPVQEPSDKKVRRNKPEVPEYLRAGRRPKIGPLLATTAVVFLLAVVAFFTLWPLDATHPLASLFGFGETDVVADNGQEGASTDPDDDTPAGDPATPTGDNPDGGAPADGTPTLPVDTDREPGPGVVAPVPPDAADADDADDAAEPPEPTEIPETPETDGAPTVIPDDDVGPAPPAGDVTDDVPDDIPDDMPDDMPDGPADDTPDDVDDGTGPADDRGPVDVGRFISDEQVLLRFDSGSQSWLRLEPRATVVAGDELLVLPTYRPQLAFHNGVQLTLLDRTRVRLVAPDANGVPTVEVQYGRVLAMTVGRPGTQVDVAAGPRRGRATFGDADSAAAVEVRPIRQPGTDPEQMPGTLLVDIIATSGRIGWEEPGQTVIAIEAGQARTLNDDRPGITVSAGAMPDWIQPGLSEIDRRASLTLESFLPPARPIGLSLEERAEDRRAEVRSLAIRSLGYLDEFDAFVTALNDVGQRSSWPAHFDCLQEALARGPETAGKVRESLERARQKDAPALYRLLWGYSDEDLETGSAKQMVEFLDNESLDLRVLSFENLHRITGMTALYRPEYPDARRRPYVASWRDKLDKGEVVRKGARAEPAAP